MHSNTVKAVNFLRNQPSLFQISINDLKRKFNIDIPVSIIIEQIKQWSFLRVFLSKDNRLTVEKL